MIFKFGRKKFSDVVKVVEFLDKSSIEYEVLTDIEIGLGKQEEAPAPKKAALTDEVRQRMEALGVPTPEAAQPFHDPAWKMAWHMNDALSNELCNDKTCKNIAHYGGQAL